MDHKHGPELLALKDSLETADYLSTALAWMQAQPPNHGSFTPADLQRLLRCTHSQACRILEALQRDGELVRSDGPVALRWVLAPAATKVGRDGYQLPLTTKEHGALLRLLDFYLGSDGTPAYGADDSTLRAIRGKLKRPV